MYACMHACMYTRAYACRFVHEARAQEQGSLHLTIAIPTQDFTWAGAVLDALRMKLREPRYEGWRRCVPRKLLAGGQTLREEQAWREELQVSHTHAHKSAPAWTCGMPKKRNCRQRRRPGEVALPAGGSKC